MLTPIDERREVARPQQAQALVLPPLVNHNSFPDLDRNTAEAADGQALLAFLWRRKGAIVAAAILGICAGWGAALMTRPVYRAHTSLQLQEFNQAWRDIAPVSQLQNASPEDYLQNEVKVLESDTLARRVAEKLGPLPEPKPGLIHSLLAGILPSLFSAEPRGEQERQEQQIRRIKNAITVRTALQSQVIELYFDAPDPALAARGANAVAAEFQSLNREARFQLVQDTTEWLNKQAAELKAKMQAVNQQLQDFTTRSGLVVPGENNTPAQDRLRQLQDALTRAEADRAAKQARYEASSAKPEETMSDALASGPLRQYQQDLQTMRRQLADLKTIYTPDNYKVTRLAAQIAETESAIDKERKAVLDQMRGEYLASANLEKMLSLSLERQLATVEQQTKKELQYNVLKNELDTNQKLYDSVLERAKEAGAASSFQITNIRVIDPATAPRRPYSPDLPLNLAIGFGLGTIGAVGLVLFGSQSAKIRHPGELKSAYVPELGVVPSVSTPLAITGGDRSLLGSEREEVDSMLLRESFRSVLTSILFSSQPQRGSLSRNGQSNSRVLVVTSCDMMEGKTTVVTNLGIASALQKRDVLLIDADVRRPRLHQRLKLSNDAGLSDLLQRPDLPNLLDSAAPESLVQATEVPHLWVLTAGQSDTDPANLLYSSDMSALVQRLSHRFDLIFIDTPPMSMYADARVLGQMSDGVVMVVRANTNSRDDVKAAYHQLLQDQIRVLGTILNDWKVDRSQARSYTRYYQNYERRAGGAA